MPDENLKRTRYVNIARFACAWAERVGPPFRESDIEELAAELQELDTKHGGLAGRTIVLDTDTGRESVGE